MLKFIFLFVVAYLTLRLFFRLLRGVLSLFFRGNHDRRSSSPAAPSSERPLDETDYEVLESRIQDKER